MTSLVAICIGVDESFSNETPLRAICPPNWLPASSAASVRELTVAITKLAAVPENKQMLQFLTFVDCKDLLEDWLPACSRGRVHTLSTAGSIRRLPEDMPALKYLCLSHMDLQTDWLPVSSTASLTSLSVRSSNMERIPEGLAALVVITLMHCSRLADD
jgi:hypothetical protein